MALDLNSPSVANPYSGTDGGLTFLKLQEDAFKNAEALIVLHRNERALEVGPARIDPETNYQESRNTQNADVLKEAKIAARIIDEILMNPSLSADVRAKLETSRSKLDLVINNNGAIGSSDTMLTIMGMVGEAYAEVEAAETASAAEAITGFARASNAIAVHQAVERQRTNYRGVPLDEPTWVRIEALSQDITPHTMDKFTAALIANDASIPAGICQKGTQQRLADYFTQTEKGKETVILHNAVDQKALVQANTEFEETHQLITEILAKPDCPATLRDSLNQAQTSKLSSTALLENLRQYHQSPNAALAETLQTNVKSTLKADVASGADEIHQIAKIAGIPKSYADTRFGKDGANVAPGYKDIHENMKWLTHPASEADKVRKARMNEAWKEFEKLKTTNPPLTPDEIDAKLRKQFPVQADNSDPVRDAYDKVIFGTLTGAEVTRNISLRAMDIQVGPYIKEDLQLLATQPSPEQRQHAVEHIAEIIRDKNTQFQKMPDRILHKYIINAAETIGKNGGIQGLYQQTYNEQTQQTEAKVSESAVLNIAEQSYANYSSAYLKTLAAAASAAAPLAQSGISAEQPSATSEQAKTTTDTKTIADAGKMLGSSNVTATQSPAANTPAANAAAPLPALAANKPAAAAQITA